MISRRLVITARSSEVDSIDRSKVLDAFPQIFTRQGKVIDYMNKIGFKPDIKITQQKKGVWRFNYKSRFER